MEECPFCTTTVPDGAIVCRGCGATKTINGMMLKYALVFSVIFAVFGGVPFFRGMLYYDWGKEYRDALFIGICVLLVGCPLLYWTYRKAFQHIWVRSI